MKNNQLSQSSTERVLIVTALPNDAELTTKILNNVGLQAETCRDLSHLCQKITDGAGAVLLGLEVFGQDTTELQNLVTMQPTWSDVPFVILTAEGLVQDKSSHVFSWLRNVTFLEKPTRVVTLVSSLKFALAARKRQYQVRDLLNDLIASQKNAEDANRTKSIFLANMSHEIRTPIGAIIGFLGLLREADGDPIKKQEFFDIIERNSNQLLRLIDDILDLSKVEAGQISLENVRFSLAKFLRDFSSTTTLKAREKGISFKLILLTEIPEYVVSDATRLKQIVGNIVGNALKFTTQGEVILAVSFEVDKLTLTVTDSGIGISKSEVLKLFKPFVQADPSVTRAYGGTGLGLALTKKLTHIMGGDFVLKSTKINGGSVFSAWLTVGSPEFKSEDKGPEKESSADTANPKLLLKGKSILIVEDSPDNQALLKILLTRQGAEVAIGSDGQEGSDMALKNKYDIILMDVQMPRMDGHQATRILRKNGYIRPIIALTAHAMNEERVKCLESGFTDFLSKPIQYDLLLQTVLRLM